MRSVPDSCYPETLVLRNSVLHKRSCLGPRRSNLAGAARRLLTGRVHTLDGVLLSKTRKRGCLRSKHAWAHGEVLQTEKTFVRDDFRRQRWELAGKNSRELLMALWNERRPECAHQLTGKTKDWKIASARAPTRLHRCAVCDEWLHTGPVSSSALLDGCGLLVLE